MSRDSKNRYWAFVWYGPLAELVSFLDDTHLKYTISPYHDRDINPDGEPKKPHYHVLVCWDGPTTYKNASATLGEVATNGHLENVCSARGMYRYFVHADNPLKAQYKDEDRTNGNGFNPADLLSETDKNMLKLEIRKMINQFQLSNFYEVDEYLINEGLIGHWAVFQASANYFNHLLKAKSLLFMKKNRKISDGMPGAVSSVKAGSQDAFTELIHPDQKAD